MTKKKDVKDICVIGGKPVDLRKNPDEVKKLKEHRKQDKE